MEQLEESLHRFRETIELFMHSIERHVYALLGSDKQPSWHFPTFSGLLPAIIGGIIGCILCIYLNPSWFSARRQSKGVPTVLLVGPPDAGKTSLFVNLVQGEHPQTHTSIQVSDTTFPLASTSGPGSKQVRLVDIPGHPRLRDEIKKHVVEARAVVFVVDIVALVRNAASVAEQLPPLMTLLASTVAARPTQDSIQLLLLAHKADLLRPADASASPPSIPEASRTTATDRLKTILTREMDRLKAARGNTSGKIEGMSSVASGSTSLWSRLFGGGGVQSESGEGEDVDALVWGGKGPFRWEDVDGVEVQWGCAALGGVRTKDWAMSEKERDQGDGLDDLRDFIWEL